MGDRFTVANARPGTWPNLKSYGTGGSPRPKVQAALSLEGLSS